MVEVTIEQINYLVCDCGSRSTISSEHVICRNRDCKKHYLCPEDKQWDLDGGHWEQTGYECSMCEKLVKDVYHIEDENYPGHSVMCIDCAKNRGEIYELHIKYNKKQLDKLNKIIGK